MSCHEWTGLDFAHTLLFLQRDTERDSVLLSRRIGRLGCIGGVVGIMAFKFPGVGEPDTTGWLFWIIGSARNPRGRIDTSKNQPSLSLAVAVTRLLAILAPRHCCAVAGHGEHWVPPSQRKRALGVEPGVSRHACSRSRSLSHGRSVPTQLPAPASPPFYLVIQIPRDPTELIHHDNYTGQPPPATRRRSCGRPRPRLLPRPLPVPRGSRSTP